MNLKKNIIKNIISLFFFIFACLFLQIYFMNKYLNLLRLSEKKILNINRYISEDNIEIYLNKISYELIKKNNLVAIKFKNTSNKFIETRVFSNYSSEKDADGYTKNYSNNSYVKVLPNSSSILYLIPYLSECFYENKECTKSSPVFLNFQIPKIKELIIEDVSVVIHKNLPFLLQLNDFGQKYLISKKPFNFRINKKSYDNSTLLDDNFFKISKNFLNYAHKRQKGIYINKRLNSNDICLGKNFTNFTDVNIVSICGKTFHLIKSKKIDSLQFDRLGISGKLKKGNLRFVLEDQYKNITTKIFAGKGEFFKTFIIDKENYYFLSILGEINVYDYPQIEFLLNKIKLFNSD